MVCRNAHIEQLEQRRYRLISDYVVAEPEIRARLHGLELDRSKIGAADCPYIPIRFVPREKPSAYDRLLLAFDAYALSQVFGKAPRSGKIIHGRRVVVVQSLLRMCGGAPSAKREKKTARPEESASP